MGCGQKACADDIKEKNDLKRCEEAKRRVERFDPLTLGLLLNDLESYIDCELGKENTRYGFKNLERLRRRLKNE